VVRFWAREKAMFVSVALCRKTLFRRSDLFGREADAMIYMQCRV
jgi:hypothetical protein